VRFLKKGDRVALLAPSSPQPKEALGEAVESVRKMGLEPAVFPTCSKERGFLAGTDEERAKDINSAFADPEIAGVLAIRGGYGAHRLMGLIDWGLVRSNPKPLFGYSDVTALHLKLSELGIPSFQAPMPGTEWGKGLDPYTEKSLKACLFGPLPEEIRNPEGAPFAWLVEGRAEGTLTGGNLMLMASTLGTGFELDTKGKIVFFEEVEESPQAIDRMLLQLRQCGKFEECAGVIAGGFQDCAPKPGSKSLSLQEVLCDHLAGLSVPVLTGFQCGHVTPTASLPFLARVRIDTASDSIRVLGYP
jgi:muramoyltetrapeptide carboxypeptidase